MTESARYIVLQFAEDRALMVRDCFYFRDVLPLINTLNHPIRVSSVQVNCPLQLKDADGNEWVVESSFPVMVVRKKEVSGQ